MSTRVMTDAPETRYQRIGREQAERRERREKQRRSPHRKPAGLDLVTLRRERRRQEATELEADRAPDSFDPPDSPQY